MNKHLIATLLIAVSAAATGSAFASDGFGDTPIAGAPASPSSPNRQTVAIAQVDHGMRAFGGVFNRTSKSATRLAERGPFSTYSHH